MNINLSMLIRQLQGKFPVQCYGTLSRSISGIKLVRDSHSIDPDAVQTLHVFLLKSPRQISDFPQNVPMLCVVHPENLAIQEGASFGKGTMMLVYAETMEDVLIALSELLYQCGQLSTPLEDMCKELLKCQTMEQVLDMGAQWLKNPLAAADSQQRILSQSASLQTDLTLLESLLRSGDVRTTVTTSNRSGWPAASMDENGKPRYLCKTLCSGGHTVGYLLVCFSLRPYQPEDDAILELIGNFCTMFLLRRTAEQSETAPEAQPLESLLSLLLEDAGNTRSQVEQYIEKAKLRFKSHHYLLAVLPINRILETSKPVHGIVHILESAIPCTMGGYYEGTLMLMIESDCEITDFNSVWAPLERLLREHGFQAGISNVCCDLMNLKDYYHQSCWAAELGQRYFPEETLIPYYRCSPYHILDLATQFQHPLHFCDPSILALHKLDRQNNTELIYTLWTYLESGRNKAKTAQKLFLHINGLKYRLAQISEVVDISYTSLEDELRLYLSLLLIRSMDTQPPEKKNEHIQNK